jgi:hypothetical protein
MRDAITRMLFGVVEELNQMLPREQRLEKDLAAPLAGDLGKLDSAGLINLIVLTEEKAVAELGRPVLLTDDDTLARINQVFGTLGTLAGHIHRLLNEKGDG